MYTLTLIYATRTSFGERARFRSGVQASLPDDPFSFRGLLILLAQRRVYR